MLSIERIASLTNSWSSAMMILAGEEEEVMLLGLCVVVVVSLAFLFANALVFAGCL
jgi:hypothetical protein